MISVTKKSFRVDCMYFVIKNHVRMLSASEESESVFKRKNGQIWKWPFWKRNKRTFDMLLNKANICSGLLHCKYELYNLKINKCHLIFFLVAWILGDLEWTGLLFFLVQQLNELIKTWLFLTSDHDGAENIFHTVMELLTGHVLATTPWAKEACESSHCTQRAKKSAGKGKQKAPLFEEEEMNNSQGSLNSVERHPECSTYFNYFVGDTKEKLKLNNDNSWVAPNGFNISEVMFQYHCESYRAAKLIHTLSPKRILAIFNPILFVPNNSVPFISSSVVSENVIPQPVQYEFISYQEPVIESVIEETVANGDILNDDVADPVEDDENTLNENINIEATKDQINEPSAENTENVVDTVPTPFEFYGSIASNSEVARR